MVTRVKLKCYSEKISTEVLGKVNNVIKNLQSSKEESQMLIQPKEPVNENNKKSFYNKFLGIGSKNSAKSDSKNLESNLRKKYELEMEKEMESIKSLKIYLEEQALLMKKTIINSENSTKRNLNENKKILNDNEELKIQLSEMKENIRQLNNNYQS
jgi:hypothetical protein